MNLTILHMSKSLKRFRLYRVHWKEYTYISTLVNSTAYSGFAKNKIPNMSEFDPTKTLRALSSWFRFGSNTHEGSNINISNKKAHYSSCLKVSIFYLLQCFFCILILFETTFRVLWHYKRFTWPILTKGKVTNRL